MRHLVVCLVVAVGCGGGDGISRPSVATNQGNVCDEVAQVACYNLYSCCSEGEIENALNVNEPRSQDECVGDFKRLCVRALAQVQFSLDKQRVQFDATTMDTCLAAIEAPDGTCATVSSMLPWTVACMTTAWKGITADGSMCNFGYECSVDSTCNASGVCAAKPGSGQPCGSGCATNLFCSNTGMCAPLPGSGQSCASGFVCMKGLFCDTNSPSPTCQMLRDTGQACTGNQSCVSSKCIPGICAGTGQQCFANNQCSMHCSNNNNFCSQDSNCGVGTCSMTATSCSFPSDCVGVGNTCNFTNRCVPGTCGGSITCADNELTVDYCKNALSTLPIPH